MKEEIIEYMENMLWDSGSSHDIDHTLRVRDLCMKIWKAEWADLEILEIAALLHDIWRQKEFETIPEQATIPSLVQNPTGISNIAQRSSFDMDKKLILTGEPRFRLEN